MLGIFLSTLLSLSAQAESGHEISFEQSYQLIEQKIEVLKAKGEKIDEQTRKDLEGLLAQMNHQHTQLKRELDEKTKQVNEKIETGRKTGEDWSKRASSAFNELKSGFTRAWDKLNHSAGDDHESD